MKNILLILLTFSALGIRAQSYNFLGEYDWRGTPLYLEAEGDNVSVETLEMISNSLPESYPVPDYNPQYITSGYDTDIKLNDDADVWITFISEGAGYRNVLGFYKYDLENPLTSNPTKDYWKLTAKEIINSIELYDAIGRKVLYLTPKSETSEINATLLANGVYILKINSKKTIRLIKR